MASLLEGLSKESAIKTYCVHFSDFRYELSTSEVDLLLQLVAVDSNKKINTDPCFYPEDANADYDKNNKMSFRGIAQIICHLSRNDLQMSCKMTDCMIGLISYLKPCYIRLQWVTI